MVVKGSVSLHQVDLNQRGDVLVQQQLHVHDLGSDLKRLRDLHRVLQGHEGRQEVVQRSHFHLHGRVGVAMARQATIAGPHCQPEEVGALGGQRSLQSQDPRDLVQGEVAQVT